MVVTPLIDRPEVRQQLWPLSVEAYHALGEAGLIPERTELLYGFVFHKVPKSPLHVAVLRRLLKLLQNLLSDGLLLRSEQPIHCRNSEPEPDVAVIQGHDEDFWSSHPTTAELVIEVAVTSEDYDRGKAAAYATAGVKEFWIVLVPECRIEIHRAPADGAYASVEVFAADEAATSEVIKGFAVTPSVLLTK